MQSSPRQTLSGPSGKSLLPSWQAVATVFVISLCFVRSSNAIPPPSPALPVVRNARGLGMVLSFLANETASDFRSDNTGNQITMQTLISNFERDTFKQALWLGSDCQYKLDDVFPAASSLVSVENSRDQDVIEGENARVSSKVNIDTANIGSSGRHVDIAKSIYSEYIDEVNLKQMAKVEFCIRSDLGEIDIVHSDNSTSKGSVVYNKVKVGVFFLMEVGFSSANVSVEEEVETQRTPDTPDVQLISGLIVCDCPADALSQADFCSRGTTYNQNSILNICIYDDSNNVNITSVKDVTMSNREITAQVVSSDGKASSLASITKLNESMAIVSTRIISAFYDLGGSTSLAPITVSGTVVFGFKTAGTRKLAAVGIKGDENMRKLQDDDAAGGNVGSFTLEVELSNVEQTDESTGFYELEYGMTLLMMFAMIPLGVC